MRKGFVMLCVTVFSLIGSYIPVLLGDSYFGIWSMLGGTIGGLCGVWVAVWLAKRYGD